ncbi:MAG: DUF6176 family protein [Candidatus Bathyarchaeota archaeon]|nr:DUF6176 family protein [Candidatus Bathyarchaeota archaeon]
MDSIVMAIPILSGKNQEAKEYFQKLTTENWQDFCKSEERLGVLKERDFLQVTPSGDILLMYLEAEDINKVFEAFAASKEPFDVYIKQEVQKFTGVDFNQSNSEPLPQLLLTYK